MVEPLGIALAAAEFALELAPHLRDKAQKESLEEVYTQVAKRTIQECERRGFWSPSPVWNELTGLLYTEGRARQLAQLFLRPSDPLTSPPLNGLSAEVLKLVQWFIGELYGRIRGLLSDENRAIVDTIIGTLNARLSEMEARLKEAFKSGPELTRYEGRRIADLSRGEADFLGAHAMSIQLVGRDHEMEELREWAESDKPISIRVLVGPAGSGKTRLALELCEKATKLDWAAGFVPTEQVGRLTDRWRWSGPTLVVVDYAAAKAKPLKNWFMALTGDACQSHVGDTAQRGARRLRVLLLERGADTGGGWWVEAFGGGGGDARAVRRLLDPDAPVPLTPLGELEHRRQILSDTMERAGVRIRPPGPGEDPYFDQKLATADWGEPLFLMMAGLVASRIGLSNVLTLSKTDLAFHVADREIERIEKIAESHALEPGFLTHMAAYVTLCQGLTQDEVSQAIGEERATLGFAAGSTPKVYDCLKATLPNLSGEGGGVAPILPDMVGEGVILRALGRWSSTQSSGCVARAARLKVARVAEAVMRAAQDYAGDKKYAATPIRWLDRLLEENTGNLLALMVISDQLPQSSVALREKAAELSTMIVGRLRRDSGEGNQPLLAMSLNNLANRLSEVGRRDEALAPAQESVAIRRELAAAQPDAFRPYLATSLNNLAVLLSEVGRRDEARAPAQEAVALYRELAAAHPDAFRPNLAGSLNNLAIRLSEVGRRDEALAPAQEAVDLYRGLAAAHPDAFRPDLAMSLNNLANSLSEVGRREAALEPAQEAVALYRELAAAHPDAFRPYLAVSLNNLAKFLNEVGRRDAALEPAQEGIQALREYFLAVPEAFAPRMVMLLRTYLRLCEELQVKPEEALLAPIVSKMAQLQQPSG
ncbi:MAG: tetratricopeptide repeat protein [Chloroflexi bacterium]|nr:tetratricopeptide repeat protein [Chloroflexota bacterium]